LFPLLQAQELQLKERQQEVRRLKSLKQQEIRQRMEQIAGGPTAGDHGRVRNSTTVPPVMNSGRGSRSHAAAAGVDPSHLENIDLDGEFDPEQFEAQLAVRGLPAALSNQAAAAAIHACCVWACLALGCLR
jgi:hypothetical protein